jgi:hypothetical protein
MSKHRIDRMIRNGIRMAGVVLASVACMAHGATPAKPGMERAQPLMRDAIRELVAGLSDAEVRDLLIAQMDRAAEPPRSPPAGISGAFAGTDDRLAELLDELRAWSRLGRHCRVSCGTSAGGFSKGGSRDISRWWRCG